MELNVIKETKKEFIFEAKGIGHTFCNLVREALYEVKGVEAASYTIEHPLIKIPKFIVVTDGKTNPRTAVVEAIKKVKAMNAKVQKVAEKAIK